MAYEGSSVELFSSASAASPTGSLGGARLSAMRLILSRRRCRSSGPYLMIRDDRFLVLVEPINHPDERADRPELAAPDRLARDPQGWHQAFELQMRVVGAAVDDPLAEDLGDNLTDPLGAETLLAGDLVIGPAFTQAREDALPPIGLGDDVRATTGFRDLVHAEPRLSL